ncbi:MAG: FliM/FliN family flagellar motor switch protein [Armatimonadota bacterium]|nr:FliM/FliN family flagellar motor switch protein [Armatimonadota bacterium]
MADILSQEEIDALIESYKAAGGLEEGGKSAGAAIRVYDFTRPDRFSKDHLRALNAIHSRHCSSVAAGLASILRVEVQAELLALDQLTYREYCSTVPEPTLFAEVNLEPLASVAIFEFNPALVGACVDLLAGAPRVSDVLVSNITDVDKALFRPIIEMVLRRYSEAWAASILFQPKISALFTESTTRQVLLPNEPVLVSSSEVAILDQTSMMSICLPASAIESVLPSLETGKPSSSQLHKGGINELVKKPFEEVELECRAILGRTELPLSDVVNLEVGDLIRLPVKADRPVELWVDNVPTFAGILGRSGNTLAVKISKVLKSPANGQE